MGDIKAGDVVSTFAGGPKMTVESVYATIDADKATVAWFDGEQHLQRATVSVAILRRVQS
jgi:uncharacterized protein YodC (DUF2158 family)